MNTADVEPPNRRKSKKQTRLVLNGLSVLKQLGEHLDLPTAPALLDELVALARAQRRALKAAHTQLEADPLLAHLLKSRITYRHVDERGGKSGKRVENMLRLSFFLAQSLHFRGGIDDWRKLLGCRPEIPVGASKSTFRSERS